MRGQCLGSVVVEYGHDPLHDDRAVIVLVVDEVHRASAHLNAIFEDALMHVQSVVTVATEGGDQRRMMFVTRFSKSGGIKTCFRNPPMTTSCTSASRQARKMASLKSSGDAKLRGLPRRDVGIGGELQPPGFRTAGDDEFHLDVQRSRGDASEQVTYVVPPPEMSTAIGRRSLVISDSSREGSHHRQSVIDPRMVRACLCAGRFRRVLLTRQS